MELLVIGRNGVSIVEDVPGGKCYMDGSGGITANVANATLTPQSTTRQTDDGAAADVTLILPPANQGGTFEFCNLSGHTFKQIASGTDKIFLGQSQPAGGSHVYSSEVNAVWRLFVFKPGQWHVISHEGEVSIG